jgi:hypothetical protein
LAGNQTIPLTRKGGKIMDDLVALVRGERPESVWLYLGLMAAIALFGLYQSNRGRIVVFANYTDVAGAAAVTGVFTLLVRLGLHQTGFVPLGSYIRGK